MYKIDRRGCLWAGGGAKNRFLGYYHIYVINICLFLKILSFLIQRILKYPKYRCHLIGRVQYLCIIEHAVENIP